MLALDPYPDTIRHFERIYQAACERAREAEMPEGQIILSCRYPEAVSVEWIDHVIAINTAFHDLSTTFYAFQTDNKSA